MTQPHGRSLADRYPDAVDLVVSGASAIVVCVGTIIQRGTDPDALFGAATLGVGVGAVVLWSMRRRRDRAGRAAAALLEQRLSIARELHDVVAHHVSLIGVEAAAARRTLDRSPSETAVALSAIEASSRAAVVEMQRLVTTLRRPDPTDDGTGTSRAQARTVAASPAPPAPTLADLPAMCQRIREAGLAIDASGLADASIGDGLSAAAQLAIYRIAQEALTNALRHGTGAVSVSLEPTGDEVVLVVAQAPGTRPLVHPTGTGTGGMGIPGMRERARAVGGTVEAGPTAAGGFSVTARVPT